MGRSGHTALHGLNAAWLEDQLRAYLADPSSVEPSLKALFETEGFAADSPTARPSPKRGGLFTAGSARTSSPGVDLDVLTSQVRIVELINAYRTYGHLKARLDPLGLANRNPPPELDPSYWGFTAADMARTFSTAALHGPQSMTLRQLVAFLEDTYSRSIGAEFKHISNAKVQDWIQERCERTRNHYDLDPATQGFVLEKLCAAEALEDFINLKFRGSKRFSLQGAESLIPMLAVMVEEAGQHGVREIVLGMPHRGRLNVLVNIFQMSAKTLFSKFEDKSGERWVGRGDVKYHLGQSADITTRFGDELHLSLTFNPSHLEAINPVVLGRARAKQDRIGDTQGERVLPVLIHGDAAFAGQGLVAETLNLMALKGYDVGGSLHIIVNNQIGFTTLPEDSRSAPYCTDIAKMIEVPIFHVNGEDPEAVVQVMKMAADYRQTFGQDVIIDMYCFRRFGHNESDEPTFTQPKMYETIDAHPSVHRVYGQHLAKRGQLTVDAVEAISQRQHTMLDQALRELQTESAYYAEAPAFGGVWQGYTGGPDREAAEAPTAVTPERARQVLDGLTGWPEGFTPHRKIGRLIQRRRDIMAGTQPLDWAAGEALAFGTLLLEGHPVRVSGQDSCRGTFSHRHAVLTDPGTGDTHTQLAHLSNDQARLDMINSPLSEAGVLGFEFGYAMDMPEALVIWEAQFGDFANGAQVMIDQFLSASEDKWNRLSAVTLFLPHGYEGQGPEHSSARLERFLQLCAEDNIQVANPTTPAQLFHLLRRQVRRRWRKPLIVMTPKSLLRHRLATSPLEDITSGGFERVVPDREVDPKTVRRAVLCSGKVYYDLYERRAALAAEARTPGNTALLRLELIYPFPDIELREIIAGMPELDELVICQEEPRNMGSFAFLFPLLGELFAQDGPALRWVSRPESASPATGSAHAHGIEQNALLANALPAPSQDKG